MSKKGKAVLYFSLALILPLIVDQIAKVLIVGQLALGETVGSKYLNLAYYENSGIAFSIPFPGYLLYVLIGFVFLILFYYYRRYLTERIVALSLGLITGGALSNLSDRLIRGAVIDYVGVLIWPFFNLADVMIAAGVILLAYREIQETRKEKKEAKNQ